LNSERPNESLILKLEWKLQLAVTRTAVTFLGHEFAEGRKEKSMSTIVNILIKLGIRKPDLEYHLMRGSMVIIFLFFGYQKWFEYEAQALIPYITHGPLLFWMYPVFGIRGATYFLGVAEWTIGALLLAGFWNKKLGILGALGSCFTFVATVTIIPLIPNGWAPSAGGFPAMTETVAFLLKDLVLLAVSASLLRYDVNRLLVETEHSSMPESSLVESARSRYAGQRTVTTQIR
jgi:uncharacterized membrane protein YkgB